MEGRILVAFATTHGSMQEVAEVIAETLRSCGFSVDVQPARTVRRLEGYRAVVLGGPLYMFRWHKDALRFLSQHRTVIAGGLPVAVFAGGPFGKPEEANWQDIRKSLDQELAKLPWFKPVSVEIVGGKFNPAALHFPWNLIPALKGMPPSDLRDWAQIRAWASSLDAQFSSTVLEGGASEA